MFNYENLSSVIVVVHVCVIDVDPVRCRAMPDRGPGRATRTDGRSVRGGEEEREDLCHAVDVCDVAWRVS